MSGVTQERRGFGCLDINPSFEGSGSLPSKYVCGIHAEHCRPFDSEDIIFRCPQDCDAARITSPVFVGNETMNYRSLVIGGQTPDHPSGIYRGDSFICAAAIHSGHINARKGGCAVLRRQGAYNNFPSSQQNGIQSIGFNGAFPLSYTFDKAGPIAQTSVCRDPRNTLLFFTAAITLLYTGLTFTHPLSAASEFCGVIFCILFFHVALVSDSPDEPAYLIFDNVISVTFERFLVAMFVIAILYHRYISRTLSDLSWQRRLLWLISVWIGALQNIIFSLPLPRLTRVDLAEQQGAKGALTVIVIIIIGIGYYQIRDIYRADRLARSKVQAQHDKYGDLVQVAKPFANQLHRVAMEFIIRVVTLLALWLVPGQEVRIHHYTYAMLFLPATEVPTTLSHIISGFLVGLFINGVARWGFASVLETQAALFPTRSFGSPIPDFQPILENSTLTFTFLKLPQGWDGVEATVNDVAEARVFDDGDIAPSFVWTIVLGTVTYFRFAFVRYDQFRGLTIGTSSEAGILTSEGHWIAPRA